MREGLIDTRYDLGDGRFIDECRTELERDGALVVPGFVAANTLAAIVAECTDRASDAYYAGTTHNVYLTPSDPGLDDDHPFNRQVVSSKGLIADDEIPAASALREIYDAPEFRSFLSDVLGIDAIHPYADDLSSINVHFAADGQELGWHFDNSSFAVTILLQSADRGAHFEFVPSVRDAGHGEMGYERVEEILRGEVPVRRLDFGTGDLVLFRGRNALHRVTPTEGATTRMLVVFAFNDRSGIGLSDSALLTFYGRTT